MEKILKEIRSMARTLGLKEGEDFTIRTGGLFDIEVEGSEWGEPGALSMGQVSHSADMFSDHLTYSGRAPGGWEFLEADRSGCYFRKNGIDVRFC